MAGNAVNHYNWNPYHGQYYDTPAYYTDQQAAYQHHHTYPPTSYSAYHHHAAYPSLPSLSSIGVDTGLSILAFLAFALWLIHLFLPQLREGLGLSQGLFRSFHPSQGPPPSILDKTEDEVVRDVLGDAAT